jgi:hypothetical protein
MGKAVQPIAMLYDALAFYLVQDATNLLGRIFLMIEKGNEIGDGSLKVNVVFPQRVVRIYQQVLRRRWGSTF